jgi:hypothetical protein
MTKGTAGQTPGHAQALQREKLLAWLKADEQQRAQQITALRAVLRTVPSVTPAIVEQAATSLLEAAGNYRNSFPIVDEQGHRLRPKVAEARAATAKLRQHLVNARDSAQALPVDAISALGGATAGSLADFVKDIERQIAAADTALKALLAQPNKPRDDYRTTLALEVALVFRDILKLKPTSTRDTDLKLKPGGQGAAYARVLRRTLAVAGWPQADLGPVIDRGLVLLKDPRGDDNVLIPP